MPGINPWYYKFSDQGGAGFTLNTPFEPAYAFGFGLDYLNVSLGASSAVVDVAAMRVNVSVALSNAAPRGAPNQAASTVVSELTALLRWCCS